MNNLRTWMGSLILWVVILLFTAGGIFLSYSFGKKKEEQSSETIRTVEREIIKSRVDREQGEVLSRLDKEAAFKAEAARLLSETPAPVREAEQRARPVPLTREKK